MRACRACTTTSNGAALIAPVANRSCPARKLARDAEAPVTSATETLDFASIRPAIDEDPHFRSPWPQNHESNANDKPIMVYLPGIDGTGLAAFRQFPSISRDYTLSTFTVPISDRSSFTELVQICAEFMRTIAAECPPTRPIYLLGESFGGILALAVAIEAPEAIDRIVLVNPATSFLDSPWAEAAPVIKSIPDESYSALPFVLAPLLSNPVAMAANRSRGATSPLDAVQRVGQGMLDMVPGLGKLTEILPKDTLVWKLGLLAEGCRWLDTRYHLVRQRVFVLAGGGDWLIPSADEAEALQRLLPHCRTRVLPMRSHALLQEADIDLAALLRQAGFYTARRTLSGNGGSLTSRTPGLGTFGKAVPVELPTAEEFAADAASLDTLRSAVSPVFFSTAEDGTVEEGLHNLALQAGKPVLLVGNHQTFPIDLGPLVDGVYRETGVLPRGLTHPSAVPPPSQAKPRDKPRARANAISRSLGIEAGSLGSEAPRRGGRAAQGGGPGAAAVDPGFLMRWGAVPVGPKELVGLLKAGETAMLFPGGATEALKGTRTVDRYKLVWSPRPEFVRMAARYGATIVPFGAVGCEESVGAVLNPENVMRLGAALGRLQGRTSSAEEMAEMERLRRVTARRGVNADKLFENELDVRFYLPRRIERFYFMFGRAVEVPPEVYRDKAAALEIYSRVKASVAGCIDYVLEERERDPYRGLLKRLAYERVRGTRAPTFVPDPNKKMM